MLGVVGYGGGLWHTWFDRDLGLAGRVLVREAPDGRLRPRLVRVDRPIARIPNLSIHLQTPDERSKGFCPNLQNHAPPLLAIALADALWNAKNPPVESSAPSDATNRASARHHPALVHLLARELGVAPSDIVDFELQLTDVQPAALGGLHSEFVLSGRLDNQCSCYMATQALIQALPSLGDDSSVSAPCHAATHPDRGCGNTVPHAPRRPQRATPHPSSPLRHTQVRMIALFDHEEVGSTSATGAEGPIMHDSLGRIWAALCPSRSPTEAAAFRARSFHVSSDMAHGLHPNYADRHDKAHGPKLGGGLVLKHNANQRYATDSASAAFIRRFAHLAGMPIQEFAVRADTACGSTIGPSLSAATGIRTADVGAPQLSMHSAREMMAAADVPQALVVMKAALEHFGAVSSAVDLDVDVPLCAECAADGGWPE